MTSKGLLSRLFPQNLKNVWHHAVSYMASFRYGFPARKMKIIGVTGTDGKTTTASIIYSILNTAGKNVGLVSTVKAVIDGKNYDTGFHVTNPEPFALQKFLALMASKGCEYAVLEVTSHGLDQGRVAGIHFDVSVLTNVTNEHLDYHKTYENYLSTKSKLFRNSTVSFLNKDDNSFSKMKLTIETNTKVRTYAQSDLVGKVKNAVFTRFPEKYNRSNASGAIAIAKYLEISEAKIIEAITNFPGVEGRMQEVANKRGVGIFIDYAHTPNAVTEVLKSFKGRVKGRLICLVSAEGERDPGKRIGIPKASVETADITIVNPIDVRTEDPKTILSQMESAAIEAGGIKGQTVFGIIDRKKAIEFAINKLAKKGDVVLICGKGHETGMDFGSHEDPWNDYEVVGKVLANAK